MNSMLRFGGVVLALCLGWSSTLLADNLTGNLVAQWIKSQKAVEVFGDKYESKLEPFDANIEKQESLEEAFRQGVVALKKTGLYNEFDGVVDGFGFDSPEQWSQVGAQIMTAYMSLEMNQQAPQMKQMMAQMQAMMDNDQIPAEQKEMMKNAMRQSKNMYESTKNVPQADIDAIKPYLSQLRTMGEDEAEPEMP
ncbi:hypothetical protein [Litoribrevibacter albus]|uniref:DUF2059 domain-containing protein n=1 Tax=Litoribrevibacter albus TaxID=1473156 RepID=A0AA37W7Q6_9GAMM|nr:hypothetical protein [Litoribrevibacter albus]GLQ32802.1 hypothetical protein GCM10007876_32810 [Litoribrevibacter albus]